MQLNLFAGLRPFRIGAAARDALAGVTLASMNIPQVLGYTRIAGTPVVTGLYTVLLPIIAFAIFGSSRHLVVAAELRNRGYLLHCALPDGDAGERTLYGAGRHGGVADRGAALAGAICSSWDFSPISCRGRCWSDSSPALASRSESQCSAEYSECPRPRIAASFSFRRSCEACPGSTFQRSIWRERLSARSFSAITIFRASP